ncbi:uncharacterized protein [Antennarius striatus]|uniref:uncharacterized protein isoform X2 n=1 Tax=Antennarius striatus TaxID=241820 RepID=UPI0035AF2481
MTRATLTKLLVLVILVFIICLPDFFTLHRASKVNLVCKPYRNCEQKSWIKTDKNGNIGVAEIRKRDVCDPTLQPEHEKWAQVCTQGNTRNVTDPASDSRRDRGNTEETWFVCKADVEIEESLRNLTLSVLDKHWEVSVELHLRDTDSLNLNFYGLKNQKYIHLYPPEAANVEEEEKKMNSDTQNEAFFCCLPVLSTSESVSQSCCLLWIDNKTAFAATIKEKLPWKWRPKDEWHGVFRVLWLVLLGVVLFTIVTTVLLKIYWGKYKNSRVHPLDSGSCRHLNGNLHHCVHHMIPSSQRSRPGNGKWRSGEK